MSNPKTPEAPEGGTFPAATGSATVSIGRHTWTYPVRHVRVEKASRETYWYAAHVGEVFEVIDCGTDYILSEDYSDADSPWRLISYDDSSIVPNAQDMP